MPESTNDPIPADAASMPFTKFVSESESNYSREHPDATYTRLADTEIGKVILEQDAKVAGDFASGRITADDFQSYRDVSQSRVESLQAHAQEIGQELNESVQSWKHDVADEWHDFKAEHPDAVADLAGGNPSIANVASATDFVGHVVNPGVDHVVDGAEDIVEAVREELGDTAQQLVEARADLTGADPAEIESSMIRVELARDTMNADLDKGVEALEAIRDGVHHDFDARQETITDYAATHPASHVSDVLPAVIEDPHLHDAIQQDTQVTEA